MWLAFVTAFPIREIILAAIQNSAKQSCHWLLLNSDLLILSIDNNRDLMKSWLFLIL
jgi:hypothetical protein